MIPLPKASILLHLTGISEPLPELIEWSEEDGYLDALDFVQHELDDDQLAGWRVLGETIFHSKTLSAVQVLPTFCNEGVNTQ